MKLYRQIRDISLCATAGLLFLIGASSCSTTYVNYPSDDDVIYQDDDTTYSDDDITSDDDDSSSQADDDLAGDDDTLEEILIESEEDGVNLIANTLYDLGYSPVIQDGTWEVGIGSGDDYVHLVPDIRFTDYNPGFSYFEFNSQEDPGVGYSDDLPFYQEIDPGYESQIVEQVQYLLDN